MPVTQAQCIAFDDMMGRRPFDWDLRIAKDRKPSEFLYTTMYKAETWPPFTGTTHLFEKISVTRPNDPGIWQQFTADPCVGAPCDVPRQMISHGVNQYRYDHYKREYQTMPFCLDQLNTIQEAPAKMAQIVKGYKKLPENICSDFWRLLVFRKAGTAATQSGLYLSGIQDATGTAVTLDITENMFAVSQGQSLVGATTKNTLFINLNANAGLTNLSLPAGQTPITTTLLFASAMGKLTMEYLKSLQIGLTLAGYHDTQWNEAGKYQITMDENTAASLLNANPALTGMYQAADFAKGGSFYALGVSAGCGNWLFKMDNEQMRFRFRADLDGKNFDGTANAGAIWIERVWPFINVAATYGYQSIPNPAWINSSLRFYHAFNREARTCFVGDVTSVNPEMKFGMARSFMGKWMWKNPVFYKYTDPNTGLECTVSNDKLNKGYWMAEFDLGVKSEYPEIERCILAIGENQPFLRVPRTNTAPNAPTSSTDYFNNLAYAPLCYDSGNPGSPGFAYPPED